MKQALPGLREDTNGKLIDNGSIYKVVHGTDQAPAPFKDQYPRLRMIPGLHQGLIQKTKNKRDLFCRTDELYMN